MTSPNLRNLSPNAQILTIVLKHVGEKVGNPDLKARPFYDDYLAKHQPKNEKIKILDYIQTTQAMNHDIWPKGTARIAATMAAAHKCAKEFGLSQDDIDKLIQRSAPEEKPTQLPRTLKGAWIMVQFRGRRITASPSKVPPLDYRIAVLVYGADDANNKRYFEIVGEQTFWEGTARLLHEQVYFSADEMERPEVKEALSMIMFKIDTDDDTDHHGILLSVAHGGPKDMGYPILASRVLLYRSRLLSEKLQVKLNEAIKKEIKQQWCKYVAEAQFGKMKNAKNEIDREIYQAIRAFNARGRLPINRGNRIFLRS
jgi:hypothetical protein